MMQPAPIATRSVRMFDRPVHTFLARIAPPRGIANARAIRLLSDDERATMSSIVGVAGQLEFAAGRILVRRQLSRMVGLPARRVPLTRDGVDRPCIAPAAGFGLDFNLSHSGDLVAAAVGVGVRVGVDVERIAERPAADAIAERFFAAGERERLQHPDRDRYLRRWYRVWTTREAHAKARGIGVRGIGAGLAAHGRDWQRLDLGVPAHYCATLVALTSRPGDRSRVRGEGIS